MESNEKLIKPVHDFQKWETFNPETDFNPEELNEYTYQDEWHAVYTIQLGELIKSGVFTWDKVNWEDAALDDEQYTRVCGYFEDRFYFREVSTLPLREWFLILHRKLVYELMPKYKPLYERIAEGVNPLQDGNEYYKNRTINSSYPETLLSENADYITDGHDEEFQRIKESNISDSLEKYNAKYRSVDELLLDELESCFISMYTSNVNGW